jgi:hypothetical protein
MRVLDLCAGLGGLSQAWVNAGHQVIHVEIDPRLPADLYADVRDLSGQKLIDRFGQIDIVLAAPPCTEYTRHDLPWTRKTAPPPDLSVWQACERIARETDPIWFVLENVRGAIPFHGRPRASAGRRYFWGWFPPLRLPVEFHKYRIRKVDIGLSGFTCDERRYWARSRVSLPISTAIMESLQSQRPLPLLFPSPE